MTNQAQRDEKECQPLKPSTNLYNFVNFLRHSLFMFYDFEQLKQSSNFNEFV